MKTSSDRPLSPHLQIYRPQITSISSILHRMTGVALSIGLGLLTWGLIALANGRDSYEFFIWFCLSPVGQITLLGWTGAFFYHLSTGVRHFLLDSGLLFEKDTAARSGWVVIITALVLTCATWGYIYRDIVKIDYDTAIEINLTEDDGEGDSAAIATPELEEEIAQ